MRFSALSTTIGLLFVVTSAVHAADGDLDTSFGGSGKVTTSALGNIDSFATVAVQNDHKIVAAGYSNRAPNNHEWTLVRFNEDGSLDSTFGEDGRVVLGPSGVNDYVYDIAIQPDGKIVISGDGGLRFSVARFNSDGSLDTGFGTAGVTKLEMGGIQSGAEALALQPDGKIVAAGFDSGASYFNFALARLNADGSVDTDFGTGGTVITDFGQGSAGRSMLIRPDGRIVVGGEVQAGSFAAARYNSDGSADTNFGGTGTVITGVSGAIAECALQSDGALLAAGTSSLRMTIARYNDDGSLDNTFGVGGIVQVQIGDGDTYCTGLATQSDGKIVASGYCFVGAQADFAIARLLATGTLDATFGTGGRVSTAILNGADAAYGSVIQPDGKIVLVGTSQIDTTYCLAIARYGNDLSYAAPTDLQLSSNNTSDAQPIGTTVGDFSTTDADAGETFTYTLVSGSGSTDNASFSISGSALVIAAQLNGKLKPSMSIRVRSEDSHWDTIERTFTINVTHVNRVPTITEIASANPSPAYVGQSVSFSVSANDIDGDTLTYSWTFGDGNNATGRTVSHSYSVTGSYTATVSISDGEGGSEQSSVNILIKANSAPQLFSGTSATPSTAFIEQVVVFEALASDADGDALTYTWDFGDGTNAVGANLSHAYAAPGTYTATVTVSDGNGGTTTASVTVTVTAQALEVKKLSTKLNFAKAASDQISVSGALALADGTAVGGLPITVDVGGVRKGFLLDSKGKVKAGGDSVALKAPKKGAAGYTIKFTKGSFAAALADEGLTNANASKVSKQIVVTIFFNATAYRKVQPQVYSAKQGKSGSSK